MTAQPKLPLIEQPLSVRDYPQVIKYMGSKAKIIDFVADGIRGVHTGGAICDLFAGAGSLAGALGNESRFISNDIQHYSGVISRCYLGRISKKFHDLSSSSIVEAATTHFEQVWTTLPANLEYKRHASLAAFNKVEARNQILVEKLEKAPFNLFTRCYSGTWWSAKQCVWIDAFRKVADDMYGDGLLSENDYSLFLTSIMHAMAYCSQGTGHFAQYRDAKSEASMRDISIYRSKSFPMLFERKLNSLRAWNYSHVAKDNEFEICSVDYEECLEKLQGGTVYADPPYAFVHYSRFYHALETIVLYDHPELQIKGGKTVKGRYRENRHQSPFSIRTQVPGAFTKLFEGTKEAGANLVLSYSNTGLFELSELLDLAHAELGASYGVSANYIDHKHMTMGRAEDRDRDVQEALIIARRN